MLWASFNELSNSSTRCEAGGARMAIQYDGPAHIGIDNQATVTMCNKIIEHQTQRNEARLINEEGAMVIGGRTSHLHKRSINKRPWALEKNGDLWQSIEESVEEKGPRSVKVTKVKGHATSEMVAEGKVKGEDKEGNDISDLAANKGAEETEVIAAAVGFVYARRHKQYKHLMTRVQTFIIKIKKVQKEKRDKKKKEKEPFRKEGERRKWGYLEE